jgi:hypothetical protein
VSLAERGWEMFETGRNLERDPLRWTRDDAAAAYWVGVQIGRESERLEAHDEP